MVLGLGVDIVENKRFESKSEKLLNRLFTSYEVSIAPSVRKEEYFASRFASKEAFVKALGTGFTSLSPLDIEIREDEKGKPFIAINDKLMQLTNGSSVFLSISHEKDYSVAVVVLDGTL